MNKIRTSKRYRTYKKEPNSEVEKYNNSKKNSLQGLSNRSEQAEKRISKLEAIKIMQSKEQ